MKHFCLGIAFFVFGWSLVARAAESPSPLVAPPLKPTELKELRYTTAYFAGATYDEGIPTQESLLGFGAGQRAASVEEIERCLKAWAAKSDRLQLHEYARSYENRPLYYAVVTAPRNLERLDSIRSGMAQLADPRQLSEGEAQRLVESLPAIAWLGFTIHGDETEGSDAALALLYHFMAATDAKTRKLLEEEVIIIDPVQNPDGRDRFVKMIAEHRGTMPNVDDYSLIHSGYWPRGRGNHYLFDLNRDLILGVHPETRGRIREVGRWNPLLFVDAHGMGSQDTHLFSPPREPINPHIPNGRDQWGNVFVQDQAKAFDRYGWLYYHGEWNDDWYPGYMDSWAGLRGAVDILYEQARVAEDGVRRPGNEVLTYRESVHHHVTGAMANLATLQANAKALLRRFLNVRRLAVDKNGPYANRTFAILPTTNTSRLQSFVNLMRLEGFEISMASNEFKAALAIDQLGREFKDRSIPSGTVLLANRQPLAHLLATMLEFDPRLPLNTLNEEWQSLLRRGESRMYDITAWNITMLYGLPALTLAMELPDGAHPWPSAAPSPKGLAGQTQAPVAYVIDGADDLSVTAAARLLERGVQVRVAEKPFTFDQQSFARGSVVVTVADNPGLAGKLRETVSGATEELNLHAVSITSGLGAGDLPNLGGEHFKRLQAPKIALLGRGSTASDDFGALWFVLDHQLAIRHSELAESERGSGYDLERYNVLIVPNRWGGSFSPAVLQSLKTWVRQGGTLIAIAGSAAELASPKSDLTRARTLPDVLEKLDEYEQAVLREWAAQHVELPTREQLWAYKAGTSLSYPWSAAEGARPDIKELKRRDAWQSLFMPQGAFVAARVDEKSWLTFGTGETLPILVGPEPVLMAADGVEAPIRYGCFVPAKPKPLPLPPKETAGESKKEKKEVARIGWCALPEGYDLDLRMSGLLWPEASHRLANAAYVTRESLGRGQIILFATSPAFRAASLGTMRILLNAIVYGPGLGTAPRIRP